MMTHTQIFRVVLSVIRIWQSKPISWKYTQFMGYTRSTHEFTGSRLATQITNYLEHNFDLVRYDYMGMDDWEVADQFTHDYLYDC